MKPRIKRSTLYPGMWTCGSECVMAYGATLKEAYIHWVLSGGREQQ